MYESLIACAKLYLKHVFTENKEQENKDSNKESYIIIKLDPINIFT